MTITSSPSRTSLRRRSSSLWSVASFTVTPDTCTGSSIANGTMCPVRPTFQATPRQRGGRRRRRELPGDRPARLAAHHAELALQVEVVHLHDHAVDLEVEPVAALLPGVGRRPRPPRRVSCISTSGFTLKPCSRSHSSDSWWVSNSSPSSAPIAVAPHRQRPRGRQLRVELADRAGGRVARVREGRLARLGALLVQPRERRQRQVDLAAHLEQRRRVVHAQRDRADRAQVLGHVLADLAVAARGAAHEHAVLVHERDRQPVDLRLGHEAHVAHLDALAREVALAAHAPRPPAPPRCARSRATASAGGGGTCSNLSSGSAAHALGGRVGRAQLRVLRLEVAQLVQQRVVVGVRDLRVVEDVVAVVVVLELPPQLLGRSAPSVALLTLPRAAGSQQARRGRSPRAPPRRPGRSGRSGAA